MISATGTPLGRAGTVSRMRSALLIGLAAATLTSGAVGQSVAGVSLISQSARSAEVVPVGSHHLDVTDLLANLTQPSVKRAKVPDATALSVPQPSRPKPATKPSSAAPTAKPLTISVASTPVVAADVVGGSGVPAVGSPQFASLVLSRIRYNWRALPFTITFQGPRAGYLGLTTLGLASSPPNHIDIFVRSGDSIQRTAIVTAYEIAHVIDITRNTDADRTLWLKLRGAARGTSWFTCNACTEDMVGAGDFSDVFAWWAVGHDFFVSQVAPPPTALQLRILTPFFFA